MDARHEHDALLTPAVDAAAWIDPGDRVAVGMPPGVGDLLPPALLALGGATVVGVAAASWLVRSRSLPGRLLTALVIGLLLLGPLVCGPLVCGPLVGGPLLGGPLGSAGDTQEARLDRLCGATGLPVDVLGPVVLVMVPAALVFLCASSGFGRIDRELRDEASSLGVGPLRFVLLVEIPAAWRAVAAGVLLAATRIGADLWIGLRLRGAMSGGDGPGGGPAGAILVAGGLCVVAAILLTGGRSATGGHRP